MFPGLEGSMWEIFILSLFRSSPVPLFAANANQNTKITTWTDLTFQIWAFMKRSSTDRSPQKSPSLQRDFSSSKRSFTLKKSIHFADTFLTTSVPLTLTKFLLRICKTIPGRDWNSASLSQVCLSTATLLCTTLITNTWIKWYGQKTLKYVIQV